MKDNTSCTLTSSNYKLEHGFSTGEILPREKFRFEGVSGTTDWQNETAEIHMRM